MKYNPAVHNFLQRIKITSATVVVNGRTLVQYSGLDEDARDQVELLHPYGYVAMPVAGSDAVEAQVGAFGSHKVVLGGDNTANSLADMVPGEAGLSCGGMQIMLRQSPSLGVEIVSALLRWGPVRGALQRFVVEAFMPLFNNHVHSGCGGSSDSGVPTVAMTQAQLSGNE